MSWWIIQHYSRRQLPTEHSVGHPYRGRRQATPIQSLGADTKVIIFCGVNQTLPLLSTAAMSLLGVSGYFVKGSGRVTIDGCLSQNGLVSGENGHFSIRYSRFDRSDYLTGSALVNFASLSVFPMRVITQTGAAYTIRSSDVDSKIVAQQWISPRRLQCQRTAMARSARLLAVRSRCSDSARGSDFRWRFWRHDQERGGQAAAECAVFVWFAHL